MTTEADLKALRAALDSALSADTLLMDTRPLVEQHYRKVYVEAGGREEDIGFTWEGSKVTITVRPVVPQYIMLTITKDETKP